MPDGGLRYIHLGGAGITRRRAGAGFIYLAASGRRVRDPATLARIRHLAIPPAWRQVWICPDGRGHIQAVGRDDRGRLQYRYHEAWRAKRDDTKYHRMLVFGRALPRLRARVKADLARAGLPREKVVATVVRLLERTLIRVGNREYARANQHYGLTTLRDGHVRIAGPRLRFQFKGKSGKVHDVEVADQRLARIVRQCRDVPGYELFQYLDERGSRGTVGSHDVNEYIRLATPNPEGEVFSAKDFRTLAGTILAAEALVGLPPAETAAARKRNVPLAVAAVASRLGNTVAVCRKSYIHPAILDGYLAGEVVAARRAPGVARVDEAAVLAFIRSFRCYPRRSRGAVGRGRGGGVADLRSRGGGHGQRARGGGRAGGDRGPGGRAGAGSRAAGARVARVAA